MKSTLWIWAGIAPALLLATSGIQAEEVPAASSPAYPVVLRLSQPAIQKLLPPQIQEQRPVNQIILGTHAVGRSSTTGQLEIQLASPDSPHLLCVHFRGQTQSQTQGRNGPAVIDSRSVSSFHCQRYVTFDPHEGFRATPCEVQVQTRIYYDGFRSAHGGLGSRLIARVAERRAGESRGQTEAIIAAQQRAELTQAFSGRLDEALASLNRKMSTVRYVGLLLREPRHVAVMAQSTGESLVLALGTAEGNEPVPALPPQDPQGPPMELWVHTSLLGEQVARVQRISTLGFMATLGMLGDSSRTWPVASGAPADGQLQLAQTSGWLRLGVGQSAAAPALPNEDESLRVTTAKPVIEVDEGTETPPPVEPTATADAATPVTATPSTESAAAASPLPPVGVLQAVNVATRYLAGVLEE